MNRTILIFALALLVMSCNNSKNKEQHHTSKIEGQEMTTMWSGIITKAEITSYQYGTHQLNGNVIDGNPENVGKEILFALKSENINLDQWIGKKVIVTGNKVDGYPAENGPDFIDVTAIENDQKVQINPTESKLQTDLTKMKWSGMSFSGFSDNNKPFGNDKPEITFSADGKFIAKFCNTINGTYELKDGENFNLKLKIISKTKMLCKGNLMMAENFLTSAEYAVDVTKGYLNLVNNKSESLSFSRATTSTENPMAE